jgi:hypothetical protein
MVESGDTIPLDEEQKTPRDGEGLEEVDIYAENSKP